MIERLRERLNSWLFKLGSAAAKTGLSGTAWSVISLLFSILSALFYAQSYSIYGGFLLLASGFLDVVDGSVARATGKASSRGAFIDSTLDRLAEILVFTGLMVGRVGEPPIILLALAFSLLVSYVRARGEAEGLRIAGIGVGERGERLPSLALFSIAGYPYYGVLTVLTLASVTVIQRVHYALTSQVLRKD